MSCEPAEQQLSGWGNCPAEDALLFRPKSLRDQTSMLRHGDFSLIARGLGRSYGDSSLNRDGAVVEQMRFNRFISFDSGTGIVECEAGTSLADIIECCLPRGWLLPTTPGTKYVTVGGAIAADVHGKNHHRDGSFGLHVIDLRLLRADGDVVRLSPTENPEVFWATIGGMGLTGIILSARVQLLSVESSFLDVTYRRTRDLDRTLEFFSETDNDFKYSVAWIDCLASRQSLGRSVIMIANHASSEGMKHPLALGKPASKSVPMNLPPGVLNPWSVKAFNALYYQVHRDSRRQVHYDPFFYPLDAVRSWNRLYGRRGFVQYQALFPKETSRRALLELLEKISASRRASFLAVLKSCGAANSGVLSYLYPGHTLALDFPNTGESLDAFLAELDEILLRHGGRLYLAKDAKMQAETFAAMYPRLHEFQRIKKAIDPNNRFVSSQALRVGIVKR